MATNQNAVPGGGRVYLLDILRICLCVGVVVYHYTPVRPSSGPFSVIGFFVLSGFFVSLEMHRGKPLDVCRFYSRKCRRLIPMFLVGLLLGCVYRAYMAWRYSGSYNFIPGGSFDWGHFSLVDFLEQYNVPLWYMGVELAFLLTVPFLYSLSRIRWGLEAMLAVSALFSCFLFSRVEYGTPYGAGLYFSPIARFWQFMAGVVAARTLLRWQRAKEAKEPGRGQRVLCAVFFILFLAAGIVLMVVKQGSGLHHWNYTFDFDLLVTLFYALLIPLLYLQPCTLGSRVKKSLRLWSDMSYPVYLVHVPLYTICLQGLLKFYGVGVSQSVVALVAACMSLILARLMLYGQKRYFSA